MMVVTALSSCQSFLYSPKNYSTILAFLLLLSCLVVPVDIRLFVLCLFDCEIEREQEASLAEY